MTNRETGDGRARWVSFPDGRGELRRLIRGDGHKGFVIRFAESRVDEELCMRARAFGFQDFGDDGSLVLMIAGERPGFTASELARALGGETCIMNRAEIFAYPWTIDYRMPNCGKPESPDSGERSIEVLGLNFDGVEVVRDLSGHRFLKTYDEQGAKRYDAEPSGGGGGMFLRAARASDCAATAAGLLRMAECGTVRRTDFERIAQAACEGARDAFTIEQSRTALADALLRQIVDSAGQEDGARASYHRSVRLAENAREIIDADDDGGEYRPSAAFLIFLKRLAREHETVDFKGGERLACAVPTLHESGAAFQVHDLSARGQGLVTVATNALGRRSASGVSVFIVVAEAVEIDALRQMIGRTHALEIVAAISPTVATARHDGPTVTVLVVGERRPRTEDSLPAAAARTFTVESRSDLDDLYRETLRSRQQIQKWHESVGELEVPVEERQRRYVPLSDSTQPFTMMPKALEAATAKALRRTAREFESRGGVDAAIAEQVGLDPDDLPSHLTAEQVDAVAMREVARLRRRSFLLADQTGVGKGRSLAAMAAAALREGLKVLYLSEGADITVPDVWRDMCAVGAHRFAQPMILATRPILLRNPADGTERAGDEFTTETAVRRAALFDSLAWPEGRNLVISTYSLFRGKSDSPSRQWVRSSLDESVLLILDEAHNAGNGRSNTGACVREMIAAIDRSNVVFATATPMRSPDGADLYATLLPPTEGNRLDGVLDGLASGGETAQESFASMLAEDGVYLRRDHDLSNIEYHVRLPNDDRVAAYQAVMDRFSPLVESMLEASLRTGEIIGDTRSVRFRELIGAGVDARRARAECDSRFHYSGNAGGPLARLARVTINALKVEQIVDETLSELQEGRKPMITFQSTSAELFNELAAESGVSDYGDLSLRHQIARVAETVYRYRIDGETHDSRNERVEIAELSQRIDAMIADIPGDLPVSPLDAVIEALAERGLKSGELTGRSLAYRGGTIIRRSDTDRRATIEAFNAGEIDVLLYNMAGATGGSYHASPEFADQRPRSLIEMETPVDIVKYIQAQGRGNRYGQVARPRIVSVMTGLIPEMRLLQLRNRKLRSLGAIIDANRSHPLLLEDLPDFLNVVGDQAAAQVMLERPDLAHRLGFTEQFRQLDGDAGHIRQATSDSGASLAIRQSGANRVLARSLVLSAQEQSELVDLIRMEFDAILEELENQNANPLRPTEVGGHIQIVEKTLFSGEETGEADLDSSAFLAPLYIATGYHRITETPMNVEQLSRLVEEARITGGEDGFLPFADRMQTRLPSLLRQYMSPGTRIEEAIADPSDQPYGFRRRHGRLLRLMGLLRNIRPGRVINFPSGDMIRDDLPKTIVGLISPRQQFSDLPQAYKIRIVAPGDTRPSTMSLSRLMSLAEHDVTFSLGMERGPNPAHLRRFTEQSNLDRRVPVQLLIGNHLTAIDESMRNSLGTMSLFRDENGHTHRGVIVKPGKVDLTKLPVLIPSARVFEALIAHFVDIESGAIDVDRLLVWVGSRESPRATFWFRRNDRGLAHLQARIPNRDHAQQFYRNSPALWRPATTAGRHVRRFYRTVEFGMNIRAEANDVRRFLLGADGLDLRCDWNLRDAVNRLNVDVERDRAPSLATGEGSERHQAMISSGDMLVAIVAMFVHGAHGLAKFNRLTLLSYGAANHQTGEFTLFRNDPFDWPDSDQLGWPRMRMVMPDPERSSFYDDWPGLAGELFGSETRNPDMRQRSTVYIPLSRDIERADRILRAAGAIGFSPDKDCMDEVQRACTALTAGEMAPPLTVG